MKAIPGMMFLLGIYCAGGYGGSVSAILINTPGTPHAAATMLDGHPLSKMGRTKAALKIALYASTFGGIFSALVLLFLGPQVAKISAQLGTAEYFMVCLFGMTNIAGVSGKSLVKGIIAACLGLLISCVGADPMTSYDRFTFGVHRLYLGLDLAVTLIGLFALVEIIGKAELNRDWCLAAKGMGCHECVDVCNYEALELGADNVPVVDVDACNGCGACELACISLSAGSITAGATDRAIVVRPTEEVEA